MNCYGKQQTRQQVARLTFISSHMISLIFRVVYTDRQTPAYFLLFQSTFMTEAILKLALHRRQFMGLVTLVLAQGVGAQSVTPAVLPTPQSLQAELAKALQQKQPLIVMVSLEGCPFCRIARSSHLVPMQKKGAPIVQLDMRSTQALLDFQGRSTTHDQLIKQWRIAIAPTLLFFGPGGKEVAERMEGAYLPDFYGPYLEERLVNGRQAI
jgi:hypothetical protein